MKKDDEYGLLIGRSNDHGSERVEAHIVRREVDSERSYPMGCSGDGECFAGYGCPKHLLGLALDGLGMYGFVSDHGEPEYIGYEVEYRNVFAAGEAKLTRMVKAIKRVNARVAKDEAREPGDKFMAMAKALKLSFAVIRIGERRSNPDWRFMTITEGRNLFRQMIDDAVAEVTARKRA